MTPATRSLRGLGKVFQCGTRSWLSPRPGLWPFPQTSSLMLVRALFPELAAAPTGRAMSMPRLESRPLPATGAASASGTVMPGASAACAYAADQVAAGLMLGGGCFGGLAFLGLAHRWSCPAKAHLAPNKSGRYRCAPPTLQARRLLRSFFQKSFAERPGIGRLSTVLGIVGHPVRRVGPSAAHIVAGSCHITVISIPGISIAGARRVCICRGCSAGDESSCDQAASEPRAEVPGLGGHRRRNCGYRESAGGRTNSN
jgi:hypothetical protein